LLLFDYTYFDALIYPISGHRTKVAKAATLSDWDAENVYGEDNFATFGYLHITSNLRFNAKYTKTSNYCGNFAAQ